MTRPWLSWPRPSWLGLTWLAGAALGLLAVGPGLAPGYILSYDMVFVPHAPVTAATLGLVGGPPRAVPSDAVMAALSAVLPADLAQKVILVAIFAAACAGAARLLRQCLNQPRLDQPRLDQPRVDRRGLDQPRLDQRGPDEPDVTRTARSAPRLAELAAGVFYAWNPYVAERLILGHWALLLGYAALPWVVAAVARREPGIRLGELAAALIPAAVGGFEAVGICALAAVPAALAAQPREWRQHGPRQRGSLQRNSWQRAQWLAVTVVALAVASLPWLVPALLVPVRTDPAGVLAFAARPDTPFGGAGSLLMLGGIWNAQVVPRGYGGAGSAAWLVVVLVGVAGYLGTRFLGSRHQPCPGLGIAAVAGLAVAAIGLTATGRAGLSDLIATWPGFAVLRDGQQYIAPLALAEAVGLGLAVAWVLPRLPALPGKPALLGEPALSGTSAPSGVPAPSPTPARPGMPAPSEMAASSGTPTVPGMPAPPGISAAAWRRALAVMAVAAPVLLLPGLAWGAAGRLRAVEYPADWLTARRVIDARPGSGAAVLLPWAAYRRYPWNGGEPSLDPWTKMLRRELIWNDALGVGRLTVAAEDPQARRLTPAMAGTGTLTAALRAAGARWVIIDAGPLLRGGRCLAERARLPGASVVLASRDLVVFRLPAADAENTIKGPACPAAGR